MTRAADKDKKKAEAWQVTLRHRVIRRAIVEGRTIGEIVNSLTHGVDYGVPLGVLIVSESTARRSISTVLEEFRGVLTDVDETTIVVTEAMKRITNIAKSTTNLPAALAANRLLLELSARQCPTFAHLASNKIANPVGVPPEELEEEDEALAAEAMELRGMTTEALTKYHRQLRVRAEALGLTVHETAGKG